MKWQANKESRWSIRLTPAQKNSLRKQAKIEKISMSQLLRNLVYSNEGELQEEPINKTELIHIRLTDNEKQMLQTKATNRNVSMSEFIINQLS